MHIVLVILLCACFGVIDLLNSRGRLGSTKKWQAVIGGLLIFLYGALRASTVGGDVAGYFDDFRTDMRMSYADILNASSSYTQSRDPVFHLTLKLLSHVWADPQIMLIAIAAVVAVGFTLFVYKSSSNLLLSFLMFICLRIFDFTLSGLRQSIAMGIVWLSIAFIDGKKPMRFILTVLIASLFHSSALVFLIAYPLSKLRRVRWVLGISAAFLAVNFVTGNALIHALAQLPGLSRYAGYLKGIENQSGMTTLLMQVGILIFSFFFKKQMEKDEPRTAFFFNMYIVGLVFTFLGFDFANIFRIGYYFIIYMVVLLPAAINSQRDNKAVMLTNYLVAILLIGQYALLGPGAGTANYQFCWQELGRW